MKEDGPGRWWHFGLAGGATLALMTTSNIAAAALTRPVPWAEVVELPPTLFGIGFVCGAVVGWLRGLSAWFGWAGDWVIGSAVGTLFFALCGLWFNGEGGALGLVVVGAVVGGAAGVLFGWDWRREAARERAGCSSDRAEPVAVADPARRRDPETQSCHDGPGS